MGQIRPKHVEIDKYTKSKLCTNLVLFTRLYIDAGQQNIKTDYLIPELISFEERLKHRCLDATITSKAN